MSSVEIVTSEAPTEELKREVHALVLAAQGVTVADQSSYEAAAGMVLQLAERRQTIKEHHADMKNKAFLAWKAVCAAENSLLDPVKEAEAVLKGKIGAYELAQRAITAAALRERRAVADLEAYNSLEAQIEAAEAAGAPAAEVRAMAEQPVIRTRPVAPEALRRVPGISTRATFKAECFDVKALAAAVGASLAPVQYIEPNQSALDAAARAIGPELERFVPGCRAVQVTSVSTRPRKKGQL